jgi:hypothetical protein
MTSTTAAPEHDEYIQIVKRLWELLDMAWSVTVFDRTWTSLLLRLARDTEGLVDSTNLDSSVATGTRRDQGRI